MSTKSVARCAHCGGEHLHRTGGVVRTAMFITTDADYGNPSSRRDGVAIELICEECHQSTEISFAQHKGETYVTGQLLYDQLPDYVPVVTRLFDDAEKVAAAEPFTSRRRTREGHAESI